MSLGGVFVASGGGECVNASLRMWDEACFGREIVGHWSNRIASR
jgi:hypothetical protein